MSDIFKALADDTRRRLLDALLREDGQSISMLEGAFAMSRFGIAKHLNVLEDAGLIVSRRKGRERLHFLNTLPIQQVYDRWVTKYTAPTSTALTHLKRELEKDLMEKVFEIFIKTTPEKLWEAITNPELRRKYQFGVRLESDFVEGSNYRAIGKGQVVFDGKNLEVAPPHRLVQSYNARWSDDVAAAGTSRVTIEIMQVQDSCRLVVTHDELPNDANSQIYGGWPMVLSGLKTLLETGETLTTPMSIMYADG
jgi:uncharacterized protein YndB with AHSA1/START domain